MVLSHQSKTTTRQRQDKSWTCAFLLCLSHQVCRTWCERHNRNAQVQLLSCRCLVVVLLWCESTISQGLWLVRITNFNQSESCCDFDPLHWIFMCLQWQFYIRKITLFGGWGMIILTAISVCSVSRKHYKMLEDVSCYFKYTVIFFQCRTLGK